MSDQPKPAAGEWTGDTVISYWQPDGTFNSFYKAVAEAHNAALAAAKPATGEWTVEFENMIYAGDEFIAIITDYESRIRVVKMHNAALAAEKEKVQNLEKTLQLVAEILGASPK